MEKIKELIRNNPRLLPFSLIAFVILVYYHFRGGLSIFNPGYVNWLIENDELATAFYSFGYFRYEHWGFPIGKIGSYFYPLGTNIYTTDIPLLALFFKPFSFLLPHEFQYIGLWYLVCHLLQGWFSILLCERFGIKGLRKFLVVLFFLFAPILMTRGIHPSLFCQWMILAALWIYFLDPEKVPVKKILFYQLCLFLVSGLVFAYMWAMMFGFSVALFLRLCLIDKRMIFIRALRHFVFHMACMVSLWLLIGLITLDGVPDYQAPGWSFFTLNLNSLYNPMNTGSLMPAFPYFINQQLEGYAYLGAGILFLIVLFFVFWVKDKIFTEETEKKSALTIENINTLPLLLFFAFSTLYALSNRITFNDNVLFQYQISDSFLKLVNSFRSSGRFFWPSYYFILLLLFYYFDRLKLNSLVKNFILAVCFALQVYDLQMFFKPFEINFAKYTPPINNEVWDKLIGSFDKTLFYPGFRRSFLTADDYRYFAYYTTLHRKKINMGYPSRFDATLAANAIRDLGDKISREGLDDSSLYITSFSFLNRLAVPLYNNEAYCYNIDGYLAIFKKSKNTELLASLLEQTVGKDMGPEIASQLVASKPFREAVDPIATTSIKMGFYETDATDEHVYYKGWAFDEKSNDIPNDSLFLILEATSKRRWKYPVNRFGTSDVQGFFNRSDLATAGFAITLIKNSLPIGTYRVGLYFENEKTQLKSLFWLEGGIVVNRPIDPVPIEQLPQKALGLKFSMYKIKDTLNTVRAECWAFPEAGNCRTCAAYFTLSSPTASYAVKATRGTRSDVVDFFKDTTLFLSGLEANFRKKPLQRGTYKLGILYKDTIRKINYFGDTGNLIYAGMDEFPIPEILKTLPEGKESIRMFFDKIDDKPDVCQLDGWAFIDNVSTNFTQSTLVLKSNDDSYAISVTPVMRVDLQGFFKLSYPVEMGGLTVKFRKKDLKPGNYQVCVMILNTKTKTTSLQCLDAYIKI